MAPPGQPDVSVIVPVYRQWDFVPDLLAGLAAQTLDRARFEILLVDNDPAARAPVPPLLPNARIVPCDRPGSYAARNAGAAEARGAWLAFTDADCRPDPGWLAAFAAEIEGAAFAAETERMTCAAEPEDAPPAPAPLLAGPVRMTAAAAPNPCEIYDLVRGIPQARYLARGYAASANLLVPAPVFHALGGFDAARFSGGDAEFCRRAGRAGHPLRLVEGAVVAHPCRSDWDALARKARRIKGGQVAAGPLPRRLAWTLRTLAPPLRDTLAYLRSPHPPRHRLVAATLRWRLWATELAETARLLAGAPRERR